MTLMLCGRTLSRHILATRSEYYYLLNEVTTHGHWAAWIIYMLRAVELTALWTEQKIRAIRQLMEATTEIVKNQSPKIYSHELIHLIFDKPYCRIADVVERGIAKRQSASTHLRDLTRLNVLTDYRFGRDKVFVNLPYIRLLANDDNQLVSTEATS